MIIFVLGLILVLLSGLRIRHDTEILSVEDTVTINGIFTLLIFLSHSTNYWTLNSSIYDFLYFKIQCIHSQWVVTTFLAFSGYGVMQSIMTKGDTYLRSFPYKRLLKTLINFDVAIILYIVVGVIVGKRYSVMRILGSFIGVTSVGNSAWYIFAILIMYTLTYFVALVIKDNTKRVVVLFVGVFVYYAIMHGLGFEARYYSTIMCFPLGVFLAVIKPNLSTLIYKNKALTIIPLLLILLITYKFRDNGIIMNISSITFVLFVVWLLCFFEIESKILYFFGKYAFSIFILQRIPGILLSHFLEVEGAVKYFVILLDFIITVVIAIIFDKFLKLIERGLSKIFE